VGLPAALLAGSLVYCVLSVVAAWQYRRQRVPAAPAQRIPISILKPLHGLDEGLEDNLRSFFAQPYLQPNGTPAFEILFATREGDDPAIAVVERLRVEFPQVPVTRLVTGEPPYPNAKVFSLARMTDVARYEVLAMADSDVRVDPGFLETVGSEFADAAVGMATCPYRAIAGNSLWSFLEALHMNTEFLGGVLTARMLEGVRFALGPTIVARKQVLKAIGGFEELQQFLAEDFVMGNRAAALGHGVILSRYVIEHRIGTQDLRHNLAHRLRWARSTRRSRPAGYFGEIFLRPLALALLVVAVAPVFWPVLPATLALRWVQAEVLRRTVRARFGAKHWLLLPVQDLLSFALWVAGFFGNSIQWRGRRYRLETDGRFTLVG
jgi:ceramide glucosyltransferase